MEGYAAVRQNGLNTIGSFLTLDAGHDLGSKSHIHFGPRPDAYYRIVVLIVSHIYSSVSVFFLCFVFLRDGYSFSSGALVPNFRLGGAVGLRIESNTGRSSRLIFFLAATTRDYIRRLGDARPYAKALTFDLKHLSINAHKAGIRL